MMAQPSMGSAKTWGILFSKIWQKNQGPNLSPIFWVVAAQKRNQFIWSQWGLFWQWSLFFSTLSKLWLSLTAGLSFYRVFQIICIICHFTIIFEHPVMCAKVTGEESDACFLCLVWIWVQMRQMVHFWRVGGSPPPLNNQYVWTDLTSSCQTIGKARPPSVHTNFSVTPKFPYSRHGSIFSELGKKTL